MLLHWTVATKQPAMTAHALAAQLPRAGDPDLDRTLESFVDRVAALIRSQAAAVAGNLAVCAPVVMVAQGLGLWLAGSTPVSVEQAR